MIGLRKGLGRFSELLDRLDDKNRLLLSQVTVASCVIGLAWWFLVGG